MAKLLEYPNNLSSDRTRASTEQDDEKHEPIARQTPLEVPELLQIPDLGANFREPQREPLRVILIGSRRGVTNTILTLYCLGFAQTRDWSPLLPAPNPNEVMSILTRYIVPE